jgi:phage protein U
MATKLCSSGQARIADFTMRLLRVDQTKNKQISTNKSPHSGSPEIGNNWAHCASNK